MTFATVDGYGYRFEVFIDSSQVMHFGGMVQRTAKTGELKEQHEKADREGEGNKIRGGRNVIEDHAKRAKFKMQHVKRVKYSSAE